MALSLSPLSAANCELLPPQGLLIFGRRRSLTFQHISRSTLHMRPSLTTEKEKARRRSARKPVQRSFYHPEFGAREEKKRKKADLKLRRRVSDDADDYDHVYENDFDFEEDDDDNHNEDKKRKKKLPRGRKSSNAHRKIRGGIGNEEYYVDVSNIKASPERKKYLMEVFKKESHPSCIESILKKRRKGGNVPDLTDLSSLSTKEEKRRSKKFGQPLSVHEIRELNRKAKPSLEDSFARNAS